MDSVQNTEYSISNPKPTVRRITIRNNQPTSLNHTGIPYVYNYKLKPYVITDTVKLTLKRPLESFTVR